jgi:catechol 2,3-dioxygenase-like lactoylglutathione lyase family enzyme
MPWTETVISVENIDVAARLFKEVGNWKVLQKGKVTQAELSYWKLPPSVKATFELLGAPNATTGYIRFIRFENVAQRPIRLAKRAWETGGIFSFMVRSDNIPDLFDKAIKMGWWAESEPITFKFGASHLRNVVLTGPHGINLAVYERLSPPFTAFPIGRISQGFNSMRMVKNRHVARDFYNKTLGFSILFDSDKEPEEPAQSNFGIPLNYTPKIKRAAAALYPVVGEIGRVEVMQMEGFEGTSVTEHAAPPNLGILSVRFPVKNLAAYREQLISKGVHIHYEAQNVSVKGIGAVNILSVKDPDGNITEFYEVKK